MSALQTAPVTDRAGETDAWEGTFSFTGEEVYFGDHFPGFPVVPGVLLFEAMRRTSLEGFRLRGKNLRLARVTHLRFVRPCVPPAEVTAVVRIDSDDPLATRCEVKNGNDQKVATARLYFEEVA
jgi:3-hydroxymyristoyl/3-hydroxydecanoyl-(acyl carrier protein) dehydratase